MIYRIAKVVLVLILVGSSIFVSKHLADTVPIFPDSQTTLADTVPIFPDVNVYS